MSPVNVPARPRLELSDLSARVATCNGHNGSNTCTGSPPLPSCAAEAVGAKIGRMGGESVVVRRSPILMSRRFKDSRIHVHVRGNDRKYRTGPARRTE